jgi:MarR family transcriptional regulator, organic hydroperoxide resistance regulator
VINDGPPRSALLALHRATHATLHALASRLADSAALDLPASEINALANLAGRHPLTVGTLAVATATKPTTLTSVLDRLVRRGYVAREVDPADRRSFLVSLTPAGEAAAGAVAAAVHDLEQRALARVTPPQRTAFFAVIGALTEVSHDLST